MAKTKKEKRKKLKRKRIIKVKKVAEGGREIEDLA